MNDKFFALCEDTDGNAFVAPVAGIIYGGYGVYKSINKNFIIDLDTGMYVGTTNTQADAKELIKTSSPEWKEQNKKDESLIEKFHALVIEYENEQHKKTKEYRQEKQKNLYLFHGDDKISLSERTPEVDNIEEIFTEFSGAYFTKIGYLRMAGLVEKYGFRDVFEATLVAIDKYYELPDVEIFEKVFRIIDTSIKASEDPLLKDKYYIRKIIINRCKYLNNSKYWFLITSYLNAGGDLESLKAFVSHINSWSKFTAYIDDFVNSKEKDEDVKND